MTMRINLGERLGDSLSRRLTNGLSSGLSSGLSKILAYRLICTLSYLGLLSLGLFIWAGSAAAATQAASLSVFENKAGEHKAVKHTLAEPIKLDDEIQAAFEALGASGVLVLLDDNRGALSTNDLARSRHAYIPASTFKLPHSLLLLEAGIVKDEHSQFAWDGVKRTYTPWNRDHSFTGAMKYSVVPIYQKLALQLGAERMAQGLTDLGYGNANIGGGLDSFWLDGDLSISALEQVLFLRRLYHNQLPVSERSQRIVKTMMLNQANGEWVLRAKTGYGVRQGQKLGWWVGWLEREENTYFFAMNMDIATDNDLALRKRVVKQLLTAKGWM
ncbi:class D beta-lactamase [Shewanella sp. Isolate7]|uniref:class D beta-lactamase n=1 Tax=Shewanella sp. Isolate7 TaxID=2908528 RepID=UPI001EFEBC11|nr:class D beta-lactamase [Shewanella sp. Isolate7]MCG9722742.1 class D beta-lactamase [Shewanella sp. Isolate7]